MRGNFALFLDFYLVETQKNPKGNENEKSEKEIRRKTKKQKIKRLK